MKSQKLYLPIGLFLLLSVLMVVRQSLRFTIHQPPSQTIAIASDIESLETLRLELATRLETTEPENEELARDVAANASSINHLAKLIGLLARDVFGNTDEAQPYLESLLEPSMYAVAEDEATWLGLADLSLQPTGSNMKEPLRRLGLSSAGLGLLGGADLMVLPRTTMIKTLLQKVRQKIEHLLTGKIKTVVGSGAAALADGPLPVGDVLAVLVIAWTAYDLHDTQATFERQLYEELMDVYREIRASMHTSMLDTLTTTSGGPP